MFSYSFVRVFKCIKYDPPKNQNFKWYAQIDLKEKTKNHCEKYIRDYNLLGLKIKFKILIKIKIYVILFAQIIDMLIDYSASLLMTEEIRVYPSLRDTQNVS
jgi:hypothetical protein